MAQTLLVRAGDGNRGGYATRGDALVNELADGVSLNSIWEEIREATSIYNEQRDAIASLLSYRTAQPGDAVPQSVVAEKFEEATEFGIPTGISEPNYLKIGYTLKDYDIAMRSTWRFLRSATSEQVQDQVRRIYEADNRLVNSLILQRLFSPAQYTNEHMLTAYGLWTGVDGLTPPSHMGKTFDSAHRHQLTTNGTNFTATHFEGMLGHVKHHGYGTTQRAQFILLMHPDDFEASGMAAWRAGATVNSVTPKYDFIVSSSAPAFLTAEHVEGTKPPADYHGLPVLGSYGGAFIVHSYFIPQGYVALVASAGPNNSDNPVAVREHERSAYRGLLQIPGNGQYPLQDSYFRRTIGVGVRHRGAAIVCQIASGTTYTEPTFDFVK